MVLPPYCSDIIADLAIPFTDLVFYYAAIFTPSQQLSVTCTIFSCQHFSCPVNSGFNAIENNQQVRQIKPIHVFHARSGLVVSEIFINNLMMLLWHPNQCRFRGLDVCRLELAMGISRRYVLHMNAGTSTRMISAPPPSLLAILFFYTWACCVYEWLFCSRNAKNSWQFAAVGSLILGTTVQRITQRALTGELCPTFLIIFVGDTNTGIYFRHDTSVRLSGYLAEYCSLLQIYR